MPSRYSAAHLNPKGAGDARPTALQVVQDENRLGDLTDKVVLITGCSSGLGIETARALKETGATLFLTARNLDKARAALGDILDEKHVHLLRADLESLESVRSCATEFLAKSGSRLNILIANAGVRSLSQGKTKDGFETDFGVNHLAHFLLFQLLAPAMVSSSTPEFHARVVMVSSTAHREWPLPPEALEKMASPASSTRRNPHEAYSHSKLANIYMANEIERRYGAKGLHAWSVHPGGVPTGLQKPCLIDFLVLFKSGVFRMFRYLQSAEQGASTTVWAAVSRELEGKGGKYLERCAISEPMGKDPKVVDPGFAPWAYDDDAAGRLWAISLSLCGM